MIEIIISQAQSTGGSSSRGKLETGGRAQDKIEENGWERKVRPTMKLDRKKIR